MTAVRAANQNARLRRWLQAPGCVPLFAAGAVGGGCSAIILREAIARFETADVRGLTDDRCGNDGTDARDAGNRLPRSREELITQQPFQPQLSVVIVEQLIAQLPDQLSLQFQGDGFCKGAGGFGRCQDEHRLLLQDLDPPGALVRPDPAGCQIQHDAGQHVGVVPIELLRYREALEKSERPKKSS